MKHGKNYPDKNIGGDLELGHRQEDPTQIGFMEGIVEKTVRFGFKFKYDLYRRFNVNFDFDREIYEISGEKIKSTNFLTGFGINY